MLNSKDVGSVQHLQYPTFISNFPFEPEAPMSNRKTRGKIGCKLGSEPTPCGRIPMTLMMGSCNTLFLQRIPYTAIRVQVCASLEGPTEHPDRRGCMLWFPNRKPGGLLGERGHEFYSHDLKSHPCRHTRRGHLLKGGKATAIARICKGVQAQQGGRAI